VPREQRERFERLDELHRFLQQSNISEKNLKRLETLRNHAQSDVVTLAALILDVARVLPGKRSRWLKLAERYQPLFARAVGVLGPEYFEDLMARYGDFESPLWDIIENYAPVSRTPVFLRT
jgi:hypothetical protein